MSLCVLITLKGVWEIYRTLFTDFLLSYCDCILVDE